MNDVKSFEEIHKIIEEKEGIYIFRTRLSSYQKSEQIACEEAIKLPLKVITYDINNKK